MRQVKERELMKRKMEEEQVKREEENAEIQVWLGEREVEVQLWDSEAEAAAAWARHVSCEPLPDPRSEKEMNTYLRIWYAQHHTTPQHHNTLLRLHNTTSTLPLLLYTDQLSLLLGFYSLSWSLTWSLTCLRMCSLMHLILAHKSSLRSALTARFRSLSRWARFRFGVDRSLRSLSPSQERGAGRRLRIIPHKDPRVTHGGGRHRACACVCARARR